MSPVIETTASLLFTVSVSMNQSLPQYRPWTQTRPAEVSQILAIVIASGGGAGHSCQYDPRGSTAHRYQHGFRLQHRPWKFSWPSLVRWVPDIMGSIVDSDTTLRLQASTWPQMTALATHISLALCSSMARGHQHGFRPQHRPQTSAWP